MRARGLKQKRLRAEVSDGASRPMRARGLKRIIRWQKSIN